MANPGHLYILESSPEDDLDRPKHVGTNINDVYCILVCSVSYVIFIVRNKQFGICDLRSFVMLRGVDWLLYEYTDVSGQPVDLSSKVKQSKSFFLALGLALEDGPIGCPEISVTTSLRCVT